MDECHILRKRVGGGAADSAWLESLRSEWSAAQGHRYREVWVDHSEYPAIRALINGDRALLLYLRGPDDPGVLSRDPGHDGDLEEDEEVDFLSGGGEWDSYPVGLTVSTAEALRILEWFAAHRSPPESAAWYDAAGAGSSEPDDA